MALQTPYLMFLGDAPDQLAAKTASGVVHWRSDICIGQLKLEGCKADLGLPDMSLELAAEAGAKTPPRLTEHCGKHLAVECQCAAIVAQSIRWQRVEQLRGPESRVPQLGEGGHITGRQSGGAEEARRVA